MIKLVREKPTIMSKELRDNLKAAEATVTQETYTNLLLKQKPKMDLDKSGPL